MKKTVRLAGIAYESLVNGPGIRRVCPSRGAAAGQAGWLRASRSGAQYR